MVLRIYHLFFPDSSSKPELNTTGDHLLYSRIGTNNPVSSSSYFILSEPTTSMSKLVMAMLNDEILYFSLSGQQYWMFAVITDLRILQSSTNTNQIRFNKRIQLRYPAVFIQSSGIAIFSFHNHLYSSWNYFCCINFTDGILIPESWLWLSVLLLLHLMLFFFALS